MYTEDQLLFIGARFLEGAMIEYETSEEAQDEKCYEVMQNHIMQTFASTLTEGKSKDVHDWWAMFCGRLGWGPEHDGKPIPDLPPDLVTLN